MKRPIVVIFLLVILSAIGATGVLPFVATAHPVLEEQIGYSCQAYFHDGTGRVMAWHCRKGETMCVIAVAGGVQCKW